MQQFHVVRVQPVRRAYAASGSEIIELQVTDTFQIYDSLGEALDCREEMNSLAEKLKYMGIQFSAQYQFEIQQVVSKPGLGGTRKRLLDLSGHEGQGIDDVYFGETVAQLLERTLHEKRVGQLESSLGIDDDSGDVHG